MFLKRRDDGEEARGTEKKKRKGKRGVPADGCPESPGSTAFLPSPRSQKVGRRGEKGGKKNKGGKEKKKRGRGEVGTKVRDG